MRLVIHSMLHMSAFVTQISPNKHLPLRHFAAAGLMLYGVDAVYRLQQSLWERSSKTSGLSTSSSHKTPGCSASGSAQVLEAVASPGGSMVSLLLAAPRYGVSPTGFVWLSIPEINRRLDWHP
jgi:hypothetical protein